MTKVLQFYNPYAILFLIQGWYTYVHKDWIAPGVIPFSTLPGFVLYVFVGWFILSSFLMISIGWYKNHYWFRVLSYYSVTVNTAFAMASFLLINESMKALPYIILCIIAIGIGVVHGNDET